MMAEGASCSSTPSTSATSTARRPAPVDAALAAGRDVLLEIELDGARQVKERRPEAVMLFIAPPSLAELERRLRGRGTDREEKIQKRLARARDEIRAVREFDYVVVNDVLDAAAATFRASSGGARAGAALSDDAGRRLPRRLSAPPPPARGPASGRVLDAVAAGEAARTPLGGPMAQEGYDRLMALTDSRYRLSMIVARRAAQLKGGIPTTLDVDEMPAARGTTP
jgi:hypothetical protein